MKKTTTLLSMLAALLFVSASLCGQTVTTFESNTTWTVPAGVFSVKAEAWGGGGGGGASLYGAGGGGGGGAYATATLTVVPGNTYDITVGTGGSGGTTLSTAGKNGNTSTVSGNAGILNAFGGSGGSAGLGSFGFPVVNRNGSGGLGALGDYNGGNGGTASNSSAGGGGGAGNFGSGGNGGSSATGSGGAGSPSLIPYLGGNGGAYSSSNIVGNSGKVPSGGGGGARSWGNALPRDGGNGARGQIVLTYTLPLCYDATLTLSSNPGTDNQTVCFNIPIVNITYTVGGSATGASVSGLPNGVTGLFDQGVFTISGTPAESGIFNYSVITTGTITPCLEDTATGTITINPLPGSTGGESAIFDADSTWAVPDGVSNITVEAWGGGGAGGGAELTFFGIGGGGGGGAYALKNSLSVTPYQPMNIVVAGPSEGVPAGNGTDGGFSTISGLEDQIYAAGGKGGTKSVFLSPYPYGGLGGLASDSKGDCAVSGTDGLKGFRVTAVYPIPVPSPVDGAGGAGATANGGAGGDPVGELVGNGNPGSAPGGGGSGSRSSVSLSLNTTGGAGASGRVVVYYVCPELTSAGEIEGTQTTCYNTIPNTITSKSSATVQTGSAQYKWQSSTTGSSEGFADINAATGASYTPDSLTQTSWFKRLATSKCSSTWPVEGESNVIQITVRPQFSAGEIDSTGQSICYNGNPDQIGAVSSPSGGDGNFSYQWQSSANGTFDDSFEISGATLNTYDPPILNATTTFRRTAKDGTCNIFTASSGTWKVNVYPNSEGGNATGGTEVCYGTNSTLLTISGQTGTVQNWQYSTSGTTWTNIPGSADSTYVADSLTADTWFRAVVNSGSCPGDTSSATQITMFTNYHISGYAKYDNNPKTPLNGLKIILTKNSTTTVDSVVTSNDGFYQFSNLTNGNYKLQVISSHPSRQWQTWNGVNNTDYLLVLRHATTGPLLPLNPPVVRISGDVKAPQTPPVINTADADAIRMAGKYGWGNPPYFQIPKWVFSGVTLDLPIDNFALNCVNVTRDIRGLCAGDVNGSYLPPSGYKMAEPSLELINHGTLPVTREITFPVRAERDMEIGAITLMLDYDASLIQITGVDMPENGGVEPWFQVQGSKFKVQGSRFKVQGSKFEVGDTLNQEPETVNLLQIGWASLNPINVSENGTVLLIHARLIDPASGIQHPVSSIHHPASGIRFTLNPNPLSELADGEGNVIDDAKLSIADAKFKGQKAEGKRQNEGMINVYPNPAKDVLNVEIVTGNDVNNAAAAGTCDGVSMEMFTMQGILISTQNIQGIKPGLNKTTLDLRDLANGAYMLKVTIGDKSEIKKVIVNK